MDRYESQPAAKRHILQSLPRESPKRTKRFYRRLFNERGDYQQDFITWSSESLALLLEKFFETLIHAEGGSPHSNDPGFDIISICEDTTGNALLRIVQVKATESNLQANGNEAIEMFERLESGDFDAELSARLELIGSRSSISHSTDLSELLYQKDRQYRLTAIHSQDRNTIQILTKYDQRVRGDIKRRSVRLINVEWRDFWAALGDTVYAQLT